MKIRRRRRIIRVAVDIAGNYCILSGCKEEYHGYMTWVEYCRMIKKYKTRKFQEAI
jgi:hypothetical protein